ncbi:MAG: hypothetical protein Q8L45_11350 [Xanthomonadaceae bacterium]|nr:hypothetical protein [Xanthomonadaceae bacterium]MDP2184467.1 hypothetical protein [Xanthomonadales bacterium]MDZ4115758.1 hypothetical protein [Xanthomonadaceae bacterium]
MREHPKSYLTDAERNELRNGGLSQNGIYLAESQAAGRAGDEETAWDWMRVANLSAQTLMGLKMRAGGQFIRDMGLRTAQADAAYGAGWLDRT